MGQPSLMSCRRIRAVKSENPPDVGLVILVWRLGACRRGNILLGRRWGWRSNEWRVFL